ncbi:Bug family tripartite tricarboxylate transporter substrate binding protein [Aurantimonas marianensis]|uniref:Tripartite tricarboxylate transporter substrate binding protein n=1 Tax=Aurantimonas marianensis TaxID=2920428 RepID=A0A9X2KJU5_9HYPH|nr:tripartite tricarboxylate transporter substrate binding protein [Aurantimonas marianensis]MCP3057012.1 tripartite tricarboxylate transporter substrate binding protein [Aurantimonas marianensis]
MKAKTFGLIIGALTISATPALAEYPERPVRLVIPYGSGGATDLSARALSTALTPRIDQPLVLVNRAGAGGATGSAAVANADGDGYTMLAARVGSHTVNPAMKATLPYTLDDFRFVGVYEINPVVCAVSSNSDIKSMEDLVQRVKDEPGTVTFSSSGVGSLLHLAGVMVLDSFGIESPLEQAIHLPMGGGGEAATAVLQGTATFVCTNSSALASFVANGQLKPILVTTAEPVKGFDAPSAASLGHEELEELVGWTGIAGPADLSDEAAKKWGEWLVLATQDEGFLKFMDQAGSQVRLMSPEESVAFVNKQYETFRKLVDDLDMRVE